MLQSHLTVTASWSVTLTKLNRALLTRERSKTTVSHHEDRRLLATNCQTHKEGVGWVLNLFTAVFLPRSTHYDLFTNTVLESSSKRRLVFLKQETTYVAGWIVFVVSTIEDRLPRGTKCCRLLKKRQWPPFIAYLGGGAEKRECSNFPPAAAALACFKVLFLCRL